MSKRNTSSLQDDKIYVQLFKAIYQKDKKTIWSIIKNHNINFDYQPQSKSLIIAAIKQFEDSEIIKLLIDKNANISSGGKRKPTPLIIATKLQRLDIVKVLISKGGFNNDDFTLLINQAFQLNNDKLIKTLVDFGIKYNQLLDAKFSLFVYKVVENGNTALFQDLLKLQINVDMMSTQTGLSLLHLACLKKHMKIIKMLVEHKANVNVQMSTKNVSRKGRVILKDYNLKNGITPLYIAVVKHANSNLAKLFLNNGAVIQNDPSSFMIISTILEKRWEEIIQCIERSCLKISNPNSGFEFTVNVASLLLKSGADVNAENENKETLLFYFIRNYNLKMIELLLENDANVQHKNKKGDTPLHLACRIFIDCKLVKTLLNYGAQTNVINNDGLTPLHFACDQGYLDKVKMLLEYNAGVNVADKYGKTSLHVMCGRDNVWVTEMVKTMINYTGDIDVKDLKGRTPLFEACEVGNLAVIYLLLENNANIEAADYQGDTPLHIAIRKFSRNLEFIRLLLDSKLKKFSFNSGSNILHLLAEYNLDIMDVLIKMKIAVNSVDKLGRTALHIAADRGHIDMIQSLLKYGADINVIDVDDETAFHYVLRRIDYFREELRDYRNIIEFRRNYSMKDCGYHNDYYHYGREKILYYKCEINLYKKIRNIFKEHVIKLKRIGYIVEKCNYDLVYNNNDNGDEESDDFSDDEDENVYDIVPDNFHDDFSCKSENNLLSEFDNSNDHNNDQRLIIKNLSMHEGFNVLSSSTPKRHIDQCQSNIDDQQYYKKQKV